MVRIEYKANQPAAALDSYAQLRSEPSLNPSGTPYALMALTARCQILAQTGKTQEALAEAEELRTGLLEGRWPLSREAFDYHWSFLDRLGLPPGQPPKSAIDFATLVSGLYNKW